MTRKTKTKSNASGSFAVARRDLLLALAALALGSSMCAPTQRKLQQTNFGAAVRGNTTISVHGYVQAIGGNAASTIIDGENGAATLSDCLPRCSVAEPRCTTGSSRDSTR